MKHYLRMGQTEAPASTAGVINPQIILQVLAALAATYVESVTDFKLSLA